MDICRSRKTFYEKAALRHAQDTDLNDRTSLTISATENATGKERNGKVTVSCGDLYKSVKIRQKAK